jgi:hypothetical protein
MKKAALLAIVALVSTSVAGFANEAIATVMKNAFKGDTSLYKTVASGKASEADARKLAAYVKTLTENEPPRGDAESWNKKTAALKRAVDLLANGNKQAMMEVQKAGNCRSCHTAHKPEE